MAKDPVKDLSLSDLDEVTPVPDWSATTDTRLVANARGGWPLPAGHRLTWKPIANGWPWPTFDSNGGFWADPD